MWFGAVPGWWAEAGAAEPAADGFTGEYDAVILGQGFGEVGDVVVEELALVESEHPVTQLLRFSVMGCAAAVAVENAGGFQALDAGLEAKHLADTEAEDSCRLAGVELGVLEQPADDSQTVHVLLWEDERLFHAVSIATFLLPEPGYDIIALSLTPDIIALRAHGSASGVDSIGR